MATKSSIALKDGKVSYLYEAYLYEGRGDTMILLHSMGVHSWSWQPVIPLLARRFVIYGLDMLGHGDSDKPPRDYKISDFAANVIEFMDRVKVRQAHIVGNSIGAIVGTEMAAAYPDRVRTLTLVGGPARGKAEFRESWAQSASQYDEKGLRKPRTMEDLKGNFTKPTQELLDKMNESMVKAGAWSKKTMEALLDYDLPERFPLIKCPTLILFGERDTALRQKEQEMLRLIKGSKLVVMPNAGHLPQIDDPPAFVKAVEGFVAAASPAAGATARGS
ncbi:MAG: alpha/beta hydrolase [Chloroflexi bacterium]|nr:alpha/beta hydrolase [Chloroflexota bacterium]